MTLLVLLLVHCECLAMYSESLAIWYRKLVKKNIFIFGRGRKLIKLFSGNLLENYEVFILKFEICSIDGISIWNTQELSTDSNSPEISFLSGTATKVSDVMVVKEKSLVEPKEILAVPNKFSESGKEALLTMNSEETQDEESSLKTFVSALEKLLTSPEIPQEERLFEIMSDFESKELTNPLSNSPSSTSVSLTCHRDLLENPKDDGLPAELLAALNTLSEGNVEPICHREEGGSSLSAGNEYSGGEPKMSQTSEDCTQITEVNSESLCSAPLFEQDSKVGELQDKHLSPQHVNSSVSL